MQALMMMSVLWHTSHLLIQWLQVVVDHDSRREHVWFFLSLAFVTSVVWSFVRLFLKCAMLIKSAVERSHERWRHAKTMNYRLLCLYWIHQRDESRRVFRIAGTENSGSWNNKNKTFKRKSIEVNVRASNPLIWFSSKRHGNTSESTSGNQTG